MRPLTVSMLIGLCCLVANPPSSRAQGLPVDRLEAPAAGAEGTTLRPIDAGHAELCRPAAAGGAAECVEMDLYDEVFTVQATEIPGDTRMSFHGHTGTPRGFIVLGRAQDDSIRLAAEYWPSEGRTYLRAGNWNDAERGRPAILWIGYASSSGENQGFSHWAPFTVVQQDGRHRLVPAGPGSTNGIHSSGYEDGVLVCSQVQGGPDPVANDDGSFTVYEVSAAEGTMVSQTLTWSGASNQLTVSTTGAPQPAPIEGDCPQ